MPLPDAASLEGLSPAKLRDLVGALVAEIRTLRVGAEAQQATLTALRAENQALRDEMARQKRLPPCPASQPSGMEKATEPEAVARAGKHSKRRRGARRDRDAVTVERVLKAMRGRSFARSMIALLDAHPVKLLADASAWRARPAALGMDRFQVSPDPVLIATEGVLWGAIRHHGLLDGTVIVSDDAGQFRVGSHALCWVHASGSCTSSCRRRWSSDARSR